MVSRQLSAPREQPETENYPACSAMGSCVCGSGLWVACTKSDILPCYTSTCKGLGSSEASYYYAHGKQHLHKTKFCFSIT